MISIAMPAIYQINDPLYSTVGDERCKWGWHKPRDIFEAISTILVLNNKWPMDAATICTNCPDVLRRCSGRPSDRVIDIYRENQTFATTGFHKNDNGWFDYVISTNCYIPAKIGMNMIKKIKRLVKTLPDIIP